MTETPWSGLATALGGARAGENPRRLSAAAAPCATPRADRPRTFSQGWAAVRLNPLAWGDLRRDPDLIRRDTVMKNLIGADLEKWREAINDPLQKLHLYGKAEARPGRKMGHVNRLAARDPVERPISTE